MELPALAEIVLLTIGDSLARVVLTEERGTGDDPRWTGDAPQRGSDQKMTTCVPFDLVAGSFGSYRGRWCPHTMQSHQAPSRSAKGRSSADDVSPVRAAPPRHATRKGNAS